MALEHQVTTPNGRAWKAAIADFLDRSRRLTQFCRTLRTTSPIDLDPAEEWLVDHVDFVAEQSLLVERTLTTTLCKRLPVLEGNHRPRLLTLCEAYLECSDSIWSEEAFVSFVAAYEEVLPLTIAEAWLAPYILRMVMILRLQTMADLVRERRDAEGCVRAMLSHAHQASSSGDAALGLSQDPAGLAGSGPALAALVRTMRSGGADGELVRRWLQIHLGHGWSRVDEIVAQEYRLRSRYQLCIGNIVTGLRNLNRLDWRGVFAQISTVEVVLCDEPTGIYRMLDDASRGTIRHAVERTARVLRVSETVLAEAAVEAARANAPSEAVPSDVPARESFVAFYLLEAKGIRRLRRQVRRPERESNEAQDPLQKRQRTYFGLLLAFWAAACVVMVRAVLPGDGDGAPTAWLWAGIFCALPASEWAVAVVHWLVECSIKPRPLLRLDFSTGIPEDATTMIVIPVIWSSTEDIEDLANRLEMHHISTRDANVHYALLGDFADSESETSATDAEVVDAAKERIAVLNDRYGHSGSTFHLFHRRRVWNEAERKWMGWERKRGKLVEFVELLRGNSKTSYHVCSGDMSVLPDVRYVITLDTDTSVPYGSVQRMVATMHLPYNRPRFNETGTRVVEGYGILQPRVGVRYESASRSWMARLWSGNPGIDPYAFALSDPYQDAFGQGIFTGKGIFDVDAFHRILCPRIPENRVLSHDLLEGGFLRAGLLSDIEVIDDYPSTFAAYQQRLHRWVRGDWQLLTWLRKRARNRFGEWQHVDLSTMTRWQIFDNLRRSLLHPTLFFMLLLGLTVLPGRSVSWILIAALTLAIPLIRHCASAKRLVEHPASLGVVALQTMVSLLLLPVQTALLLDAIARTLFRLGISKRNLLEWVSSAEVARRDAAGTTKSRRKFAGAYGWIVLFVVVVIWAGRPSTIPTGFVLAVLWSLAPAYARMLDKPVRVEQIRLGDEERAELTDLARDTWAFYRDFAGPEDNYLPPDNVQVDPPVGAAHRTSPTNIGMLLVSIAAAHRLGFIEVEEACERIENTLSSLESMQKWNGHLYNWYDTRTLEPLHPIYVSTVDSGNFVASLMVARQAVLAWDRDPNACVPGLREMADRLERLAVETDFTPLFDTKAGLFSLGYHVESRKREEILYDLMASEARQASFVAIALGQVPVSHWFALNRTMTKIGRRCTLLSWSATMFEYLMPALFMRTYHRTLWSQTYAGVLERQREYARQRSVPFGISESGYYAFDFHKNYQYRAFGVPGLGFQRGLEKDVVVAPYATALALPFAPESCIENLRQLQTLGMRDAYGFFEAIDYTADRLPPGKNHMSIRSYMAHHQGMTLLALCNTLCDNIVVEWFHSDLRVQATELLLQERIPLRANIIPNPSSVSHRLPERAALDTVDVRKLDAARGALDDICVLSNGVWTTVLDPGGGGFSKVEDVYVTRWRDDPSIALYGTFFTLRDLDTDDVWSPTKWPFRGQTDAGTASFSPHLAVFEQRRGELQTELTVCVSPDWNAEVRTLKITNHRSERVQLEVTSFAELALAKLDADTAHPAFSKLFVETAFHPDHGCLVAHRRPRSPEETTLSAAAQFNLLEGACLGALEYETNRAAFIGRGNGLDCAIGLTQHLGGEVGAVADPAFILRRTLVVEPGQSAVLSLVVATSAEASEAVEITQRLSDKQAQTQTVELAWNRSQSELRQLHGKPDLVSMASRLAARAIYPTVLSPSSVAAIAANPRGQSGLWSIGLSGDVPIVLVEVSDSVDLPFVADVLRCHHFLRGRGLAVDLVVQAGMTGGYLQGIQDELRRAVERYADPSAIGKAGGVHLLSVENLQTETLTLVHAVARVVLNAHGSSLAVQLDNDTHSDSVEPEGTVHDGWLAGRPRTISASQPRADMRVSSSSGILNNGMGAFTEDGEEYRIEWDGKTIAPLPWSNVIANPSFGFLVTELGTGYTWWKNSRECKVTPWRNDPIVDIPPEVCYLRDEDDGVYWSATPAPTRTNDPYWITHGKGYSKFQHETLELEHELTMFVAKDDPIKIMLLKVRNRSERSRRLSVTQSVDWVLGVTEEKNRAFVVSEWADTPGCLLAHNTYQESFRDAMAVLAVRVPEGRLQGDSDDPGGTCSWTADRKAFLGENGDVRAPLGMVRERLDGVTGVVPSACGAIRQTFALQPGETKTVVILLGCTAGREQALALVDRYGSVAAAEEALDEVKAAWHAVLGQLTVDTPSVSMNVMLNGWLLYQTLSCRIWARTGFYQAGGAFGFRDQLQDALALLHTRPDLTRQQILLHARHQFEEGDVEHWWHEETGKGIRTRFSDDLLWLPYAVGRYVEHTGDIAVLSETMPYLKADELRDGEDERYGDTVVGHTVGSLYEHCVRAVHHALRFGVHGIPLMGSGDWNDGMSLVGPKGKGESVWLGWFLCDVLRRMDAMAEMMGDAETSEYFAAVRERIANAVNEHAWDGRWFRRAYTDEGTWIGAAANDECRIDAIAQAWSVISGAGEKEKTARAMQSFERELVDSTLSIARLLTPAFDTSRPSPGYIQGYPAGIRENGGQYTHGVVWSVIAWAMLGNGGQAYDLFHRLLPTSHAESVKEIGTYQGEPYVMAADVYAHGPLAGRSGWTWYTGAAGWMYQAGIEWILGIRRRGTCLLLDPKLPPNWPGYSAVYRFGRSVYRISVERAYGLERDLTVDGVVTWQSPREGAAGAMEGSGFEGDSGRQVKTRQLVRAQHVMQVPEVSLVDDGKTHTVHLRWM